MAPHIFLLSNHDIWFGWFFEIMMITRLSINLIMSLHQIKQDLVILLKNTNYISISVSPVLKAVYVPFVLGC